jgi:hypothetical protein
MRDLEAKPEEQLTLQAQVAAVLDAILDAPSAQEWTWFSGTTNAPLRPGGGRAVGAGPPGGHGARLAVGPVRRPRRRRLRR